MEILQVIGLLLAVAVGIGIAGGMAYLAHTLYQHIKNRDE